MNRIVLGYDDSDASQRALERAAQIAKAFGSELLVISVAPVEMSVGRSGGPVDPTEPLSKHTAELEQARQYLDGQGIQAEYQPAVGEPATAIVDLAQERGADLIIVGTREPNMIARLLGQSVSDAVAHKAHVDVLIVHAH
jgi:nucleotide-binding universal stress UspA family protein